MAAITAAQLLYQNSDPGLRYAAILAKGVNQNDTIDVSSVPQAIFKTVIGSTLLCETNKAATPAVLSAAGTVITLASGGTALAADDVIILVIGATP